MEPNEQVSIGIINKDNGRNHQIASETETKKSDDELNFSTNLNESTAERQLNFKTIIQALQQLNADQAYAHSELYIKMCRQNPLSYVTLAQNIEIFDKIGKPINTPSDNCNSDKDLDVKEIGTKSNTLPATTELQVNCDMDAKKIDVSINNKSAASATIELGDTCNWDVKEIGKPINTPNDNCRSDEDLDVKKIDVPINNTPVTMEQKDKNYDSDTESIKIGVQKTMEFEFKVPDVKQLTQNKRGREEDDDRLNNNSPKENTVDNESEKMMPKKPKLLSNMNLFSGGRRCTTFYKRPPPPSLNRTAEKDRR